MKGRDSFQYAVMLPFLSWLTVFHEGSCAGSPDGAVSGIDNKKNDNKNDIDRGFKGVENG
jgi:hypothetical protein